MPSITSSYGTRLTTKIFFSMFALLYLGRRMIFLFGTFFERKYYANIVGVLKLHHHKYLTSGVTPQGAKALRGR